MACAIVQLCKVEKQVISHHQFIIIHQYEHLSRPERTLYITLPYLP